MEEIIYRCPYKCPINKQCFVIKVKDRINEPIEVIYKCIANKKEISIRLGGKEIQ